MGDEETLIKCQHSFKNGGIETSCSLEVNITCGYDCDTGYKKTGPEFLICNDNGIWNEDINDNGNWNGDINELCKLDTSYMIPIVLTVIIGLLVFFCFYAIIASRRQKRYDREHPQSQPVVVSNVCLSVSGSRNVCPSVSVSRNAYPSVSGSGNDYPSVSVSRNAYPSVSVSRNVCPSVSGSRNVCPSVSGSVFSTSQLRTYTTPTDDSENVYWEIGEEYSKPKIFEKPPLYYKQYKDIGVYIQKGSSVRSERYSKFPVKNADEGGYLEACHDCNDFLPVPDYEHDDWLEPSPRNGSLDAVRITNYENTKT